MLDWIYHRPDVPAGSRQIVDVPPVREARMLGHQEKEVFRILTCGIFGQKAKHGNEVVRLEELSKMI